MKTLDTSALEMVAGGNGPFCEFKTEMKSALDENIANLVEDLNDQFSSLFECSDDMGIDLNDDN